MKVALIGGVRASLVALQTFHEGQVELSVFGLAPERAGRHSDYCDLGPHAARMGVAYAAIVNVNDSATITALRTFEPDVICVFGWSQLVGAEFLGIPKVGVLGWHPSLLPENRGRGVIPWTILQRQRDTALSIFWLDADTDSGDIAVQVPVAVAPNETADQLYGKIERAAETGVHDLLRLGPPAVWPRRRQDQAKATWCARRIPKDGAIDWSRPADDVWTLIRASGRPYPGAFSVFAEHHVTCWAADLIEERRHWAAPGQIVELRPEGPVVQCGDRAAVLLTELEWKNREVGGQLRLHDRFGH